MNKNEDECSFSVCHAWHFTSAPQTSVIDALKISGRTLHTNAVSVLGALKSPAPRENDPQLLQKEKDFSECSHLYRPGYLGSSSVEFFFPLSQKIFNQKL